jgi:hypothetical protein
MNEENFHIAIEQKKIPILVLDNKWHRLFAVHGKPEEVKALEKEIRDLLSEQGQLNNDLKSLKKIKTNLMTNIVSNMGDDGEIDKANTAEMENNKRLIEETNLKLDEIEAKLTAIPHEIDIRNKSLMFETMAYCYNYLRKNKEEADEITEWINKIRIELKKNIIRKQNRTINNKEMYSYMHDIFGKDVLDLFDMRVEDYDAFTNESRDTKDKKEDKGDKKDRSESSDDKKEG